MGRHDIYNINTAGYRYTQAAEHMPALNGPRSTIPIDQRLAHRRGDNKRYRAARRHYRLHIQFIHV